MKVNTCRVRQDLGFILVEIMIVIAIIAIINVVAIPRLSCVRAKVNAASAISSLRTLVSSQAMFYQGDIDADGNDYATSLNELYKYGMIGSKLGSGYKHGYRFTLKAPMPTSHWNCIAKADPKHRCSPNSYFVAESGVVRYSLTGDADTSSSTLNLGQGFIDWDPHGDIIDGSNLSLVSEGLQERFAESIGAGITDHISMITDVLASEDSISSILSKLDSNGDGRIIADELLNLNVIALAKELSESLPIDLTNAEAVSDGDQWQDLYNSAIESIVDESGVGEAFEQLAESLAFLEEREVLDDFEDTTNVNDLKEVSEIEIIQLPANDSVHEFADTAIRQSLSAQ